MRTIDVRNGLRLLFRTPDPTPSPIPAPSPAAPATGDFDYVFVLTYGRSGSTLLTQILNSIPGYRIRGENNNALYGIFTAFEALHSAKERWGGEKRLFSWSGAEDIRPAEFAEKCVEAFVFDVLRPQPSDRVIGFKEIRYFEIQKKLDAYIDFIKQFFPECRFVVNIRDPADVAKSRWWVRVENAPKLIAEFRNRLKQLALTDPSRFYLVDYDLYSETGKALQGLFAWLGEPFSEECVAAVLAARKYS